MIKIESKQELKDHFIFTTDDILLSESKRGKIFLSNKSLFFNKEGSEKIFSAMEFLPRYVSGEIWANQLIGLMKDDDGDIIIIRGERVAKSSGSITNRDGIRKTGKDFNIEIFSERKADPNRGWFARGNFLVTPKSFYLEV